jgi:uncharacterized protein YgiM (DUF1202 family)
MGGMSNKTFLILTSLCLSACLVSGAAFAQTSESMSTTAAQTTIVRSEPSAQGEIVGRLTQNQPVTVIGRVDSESTWLLIVFEEGASGWVPTFSLALTADLSVIPIVSANPTASLAVDVSIQAYGRVNVRSGPSMDYNIISQLDVGESARATARSNSENDWLYIQDEGISGWVAYFTVEVVGDASTLPILVPDGEDGALISPLTLIRARFNVRIRAEANAQAEALTLVRFNDQVTPLARSEDGRWLYVQYGEVVGWAVASLFDITTAQISELAVFTLESETP